MSIKAYIYTMFRGADPGEGWEMTDPIFGKGKVPTMGARLPTIRRMVERGDQIFVVSGRMPGVQQYVVGGFAVGQKINQLTAYSRFPENRQHLDADGNLLGNVLVLPDGTQNPIDYHTNFERRVDNYIIGPEPIVPETPEEVRRGRVIGRGRRMNEDQVELMRRWLSGIKTAS